MMASSNLVYVVLIVVLVNSWYGTMAYLKFRQRKAGISENERNRLNMVNNVDLVIHI